HALWVAYIAAIFYGLGFGWTFVCMNTSTAHFYGPAAFPKLGGTAMVLTAIFSAPAGVIGGKLFDIYANYTLAFESDMLSGAGGIGALFFATMPAQPERAANVPEAEISHAS